MDGGTRDKRFKFCFGRDKADHLIQLYAVEVNYQVLALEEPMRANL